MTISSPPYIVPGSFASFATSRNFLVVNGALAVAWSAALLLGLGRVAASSSVAKQSAARRSSRNLLRKMEDSKCDPEQFFRTAEQFVHSCLAQNGSSPDVRELLENSNASDQTKSAVRNILNRYDEWKYSANNTPPKLDAAERRQILTELKAFDHEVRK